MPPKSRKRKASLSSPVATRGAKWMKKAYTDVHSQINAIKTTPHCSEDSKKLSNIALQMPIAASPTPPASSIDTLPDELLLCVLEHLDAQYLHTIARIKQFRHLCLANRRLNRLSNNFIYEEFHSSMWPNPSKFLRTIIANADLASRVKTMWWNFEMSDVEANAEWLPTSKETRQLRESLKKLGIRDRAGLLEQYRKGCMSHIFKLAMLHTPNLRKLIVQDDTPYYRHIPRAHYREKGYLQLLHNAASNTPIGFSPTYTHLHTLRLHMGDMWLEDALPVFHLPSLRKLVFDGVKATRLVPERELLTKLVDTSPVIDLAVVNSLVGTSTLSHLIAACRVLKSFVSVYNSVRCVSQPPKISYADLTKALQKHKRTLEVVDINDESDRTLHVVSDYNRGVLGSFQDFDKLEYFGAPMEAFEPITDPPADIVESLGIDDLEDAWIPYAQLGDVLPKTLKELSLTIFEDEEYSDFCSESLRMLQETYLTDLPSLREIKVKAHKLVYMKNIDLWIPKHKFLQSGIKFSISQDDVLEEHLNYSSDDDTITNSELYGSLDNFDFDLDPWDDELNDEVGYGLQYGHGPGFIDVDSDVDLDDLSEHNEDDDEILGMDDHGLANLLHAVDGINAMSQGVDAAMANVGPLLASLQAGHFHHHQHD